jgi:hypothetical protein
LACRIPTLAAAIFWAASGASIIAIVGYQTRANDQLERLSYLSGSGQASMSDGVINLARIEIHSTDPIVLAVVMARSLGS